MEAFSEHDKNQSSRLNTFKTLVGLSNSLLQEISPLRRKERLTERQYIADHEAGHALVFLLDGQHIEKAYINKLRGKTCTQLNQLFGKKDSIQIFGKTLELKAGEVSIGNENEKMYAQHNPKKASIMYLAGIANTAFSEHNQQYIHQLLRQNLQNIQQSRWDDITVPYHYLYHQFFKIHKRHPIKEEMSHLFHQALEKLNTIFSQNIFQITLRAISDALKNKHPKDNIQNAFLGSIKNAGVSEEQLESMRDQLFSLDFHQIIRDYEIRN